LFVISALHEGTWIPRRSDFFWGKKIDSRPIQQNVDIVAFVARHIWAGKSLSDGPFSLRSFRWR